MQYSRAAVTKAPQWPAPKEARTPASNSARSCRWTASSWRHRRRAALPKLPPKHENGLCGQARIRRIRCTDRLIPSKSLGH